MRAERVRSILAIKLDHIGDFVAALPALRRLKQHFPHARLVVLAASTSGALAGLEPAIDEMIEFNYFPARSGDDQRVVEAAEFRALKARLASHAFDIAVDLRKHTDTRHLLRLSGARLLAGFDHDGRFPWLDVVLEWEGDKKLRLKRHHISDDLVALTDVIARACGPDRRVVRTTMTAPAEFDEALIRIGGPHLFERPLVCIHPAAGTEMRQWPLGYFAELTDLLIERSGVNVAVIGTAEESSIAAGLRDTVRRPDRVFSFAGRLPLGDLPHLLKRCVLFVGNNSGPKHLAAGLGVPTIGIHSGVVDMAEWGPMGPNAVGIHRRMSCAPCYFKRPSQCERKLACLTGLRPRAVYEACERMLCSKGAAALPDRWVGGPKGSINEAETISDFYVSTGIRESTAAATPTHWRRSGP